LLLLLYHLIPPPPLPPTNVSFRTLATILAGLMTSPPDRGGRIGSATTTICNGHPPCFSSLLLPWDALRPVPSTLLRWGRRWTSEDDAMAVVIAITVVAATSSPPPCLALDSFYTILYLLTTYSDTVIFCSLCKESDLVYVVPTLDKYCCVVTIGDDDPSRQHNIPHK
jgi:hypothetical protein